MDHRAAGTIGQSAKEAIQVGRTSHSHATIRFATRPHKPAICRRVAQSRSIRWPRSGASDALPPLNPVATVCAALGLSNTQYGWTGSAFALALLAATPLAGSFLDRLGVRRGLFFAVLLWSAASAAHGLAGGLASLLALRVLLGIAEAPGFPGSAHVVRGVLAPKQVARGLGFVLAGSTAGALAALFVAVAFEQRFGWRGAFAGVAAISVVWALLWAAVSSAGSAPAHLDVRDAPQTGGASILRNRDVVRAVLLTSGVSPMLAFASLWWPKFLVATHGVPQASIPSYSFLLPLAYDAGAVALGDLAGRSRPAAVLLFASFLALAAGAVPFAGSAWTAVSIAAVAWFG
ncbi:MAG: MFS transporter, partial [Myxococcales bacterium]|nr:MFS transporter [Myxococcales bacterium]